ncbi:MAG TPA: HAD family phosphatase [Clostridiaceae bacterium]|nr:HAD family phosphatase [Clostridiaceae bacterium]
MKKEHAILFDMDGVLVDSEPALAQVSSEVFREIDIPANPEDFAPYIGMGEDTYLGEVFRKYGQEYDPEIKLKVYDRYKEEAEKYVRTFPGTLDLLNRIKSKDIKMGVASAADLIKVEANLKALGFNDFDSIITGSDIERKKPFPDIYLLAAEKIGVEPANCIVVEDATAGIESGNAAGMTTIGFTSAVSREGLLAAGADYVVDNFAQLKELIKKLISED